jgi:hypothetical protein
MTPMRRANHHGTVPRHATPPTLASNQSRGNFDRPPETAGTAETVVSTSDTIVEVYLSKGGTSARPRDTRADDTSERGRKLVAAVRQRIETRLPGRVRNLTVALRSGTIVLEGQCATYYTKQLAQHAALGVLEDEHLENAIVVTIGQ